jgi:pilus assembly protein CpaC
MNRVWLPVAPSDRRDRLLTRAVQKGLCRVVLVALACTLPLCGQPAAGAGVPRDLVVTTGKSLVIDSPVDVKRVSIANPDVAEAVGITPKEVLINGKTPGQTSLVMWQEGGNRMLFDVTVRPQGDTPLDTVRSELSRELEGQDVQLSVGKDAVFVRGTVRDMNSADRAVAIASALGKPVNLLRVSVPEMEPQILLKVRFADVDRSASLELGANFISTGAGNTIGTIGTQQFSPPQLPPTGTTPGNLGKFIVTDLLNVFLFRPDLNIGATLRLLQQQKLVEILAEPNLLATSGKEANFLAGGEFPYPVVSGAGGVAGLAISIMFKEFGVRLNFLPTITPRGTIRLMVEPEVSALDYANGITLQGFSVPGISTRRVSTEIELQDGQSFGIAGLLDNRLEETLSKVPGLGNIPLFGKLFQSRATSRNHTELLVMVTPEIVRPIPPGQPQPSIEFPKEFLKQGATTPPRTPPVGVTGAAGPASAQPEVPVEVLIRDDKANQEQSGARHHGGTMTGAGTTTRKTS